MISVAVVGGNGYTGLELLRLLAQHPQVEVKIVSSRAEAGRHIYEVFPSLRGVYQLTFTEPNVDQLCNCDLVFYATPHGVAMKHVEILLNAGVKVIDLSADFRLQNVDEWESWYQQAHESSEYLSQAVYGLPEVNRQEVAQANLVANPGCYPTAVQLGLLPLLKANAVSPKGLIADVKSGVSGAGRKAAQGLLFGEVAESFKAYGVAGHRHLPEICQGLNRVAEEKVSLTFVPHLVPMSRGIFATLYCQLIDPALNVHEILEKYYQHEFFVDVLPINELPETRSVRGTNLCRMSAHNPLGEGCVVVTVVLDNLVKGAAGQAIQNMNIMFGFDEAQGLKGLPLVP